MHEILLDSPEENKQERIELEEYLNFIEFKGNLDTSIQTLEKLQQLHTQKIPFENLNAFLKIPVKIDLYSIKDKFIKDGRGGYCFEHNTLFAHVLKLIGFKVKCLSARVLWNVSENVVPPRGHMLLLVNVNEELYVADVGFGGLSLTGPLKFIMNLEQQTPHEKFRIISSGEEFIIQAYIKENWKNLYQFGLMEQLPVDYEVPNYWVSTHPQSHFTYTLIAARSIPGKRFNLRNNEFVTHYTSGPSEKKTISCHQEIKELLTSVFKINISNLEGLDDRLKEVVLL